MTWLASRTSRRPSPRGRRVTASLVTLAQLGYAHWFFGNLYEGVVKIPDRLAGAPDLAGGGEPVTLRLLLRPGSPVRYFLPAAPVTAAATLAALVAGWNTPHDRRWLGVASACTGCGGAVGAHMIRDMILPLVFASEPLPPAEQERLRRRWHRLNMIRLVAVGGAWLAAQRATTHRADARSAR